MFHVMDFHVAIESATNGRDFFNVLAKTLSAFGVNDLAYTWLGPILPANHKDLIFSTYSAPMLRQLGGLPGFAADLTRQRAAAGLDTLWTDRALWDSATPLQLQQLDREDEAGLRNGFTHVLGKRGGLTASISLRMDVMSGTDFAKYLPEFSKIIIPITHLMHSHFTKNLMPQHYNLSIREKDVLTWLMIGMRPDEIADKLAIGYRSVDKYIVSAKKKLGANSRDHAVARALSLGLLDF